MAQPGTENPPPRGRIELHVHLDCSISYHVARQIKPGISEAEWRRLLVAPQHCLNLADYLTRADAAIVMLQSLQSLELVTRDLFRQWREDGVVYGEFRFAPLEHTAGGLTAEAVMRQVCKTARDCRQEFGIDGGVIVCSLRHYSEARSMEAAELALKFRDEGVVGFDLAGDEAAYGVSAHRRAYEMVKQEGLPRTVHAGEACGPESLWEALIELDPQRIGHGVRCIEDESLMKFIWVMGIVLEVCPTSNIQTGVVSHIQDHPIDRLYRYGIPLCINTDSRTTTPTTLTQECELVGRAFGWTDTDFRRCFETARAAAFQKPGPTHLVIS
jgi:adenosine deaminase